MISIGDRLPDITLNAATPSGPQEAAVGQIFAGKRAVLFAVPGAYTPTCHNNHMPGFVDQRDALAEKGVEVVACVAVNDVFVMGAWAKSAGVGDKIVMLADGAAEFTKAVGLDVDLSAFGLGLRSKRYAMILDDGAVTALMVENSPADHDRASASSVLAAL